MCKLRQLSQLNNSPKGTDIHMCEHIEYSTWYIEYLSVAY